MNGRTSAVVLRSGMAGLQWARNLEAGAQSILSADLHATFELIISDNASTDATEEICRRYAEADHRIRYYRNDRNLGAAAQLQPSHPLSAGALFPACRAR